MDIFINVLCLVLVFWMGHMVGYQDGKRSARKEVSGVGLRAMEKGGRGIARWE